MNYVVTIGFSVNQMADFAESFANPTSSYFSIIPLVVIP